MWFSGETEIANFDRGGIAQKLVKDSVLASRFMLQLFSPSCFKSQGEGSYRCLVKIFEEFQNFSLSDYTKMW